MKLLIIKFIIYTVLFFAFAQPVFAQSSFDFPLGPPDETGYAVIGTGGLNFLDRYDYQGDGIPEYHPGEDWNEARNGKDYGGDNSDYKDPVYAIADGVVKYARFCSASWGNLVLIEHDNGSGIYWSQYAHLNNLRSGLNVGSKISRGEVVGNVGSYPYGTKRNIHLHFEIRKKYRQAYDFVNNWSKEKVLEYYVKPTDFINSHRPLSVPNPNLKVENKNGTNTLSWDKAQDGFDHYEIYRSEVGGGTNDAAKRQTVATVTDQNQITFTDKDISGGKTYYYRTAAFYKDGQIGVSAEVGIETKIEVRQITTTTNNERNPFIYSGKVFYESLPANPKSTDTSLLHYYDITSGETKTVNVGSCTIRYPFSPNANASIVAFYGDTYVTAYGRDICYYNLATNTAVPVSIDPLLKDQYYPVVSDDGLIFWQDYKNGNTNVDIYFLDTKKSVGPEPFVTAPKNQVYPRVSGNIVVWKDSRNYNSTTYDFYMKEIGSTEEIKLVTNVGNSPYSFWCDWLIWDNGGKLSMYNLKTKQTTIIKEAGVGYNPAVNDGKIAYLYKEGNCSYLHIYEIATSKDTKIDFQFHWATAPSISGNYIAFEAPIDADKPNDMEIFLVQI